MPPRSVSAYTTAVLAVTCPHCGAGPRDRCTVLRGTGGRAPTPHGARVRLVASDDPPDAAGLPDISVPAEESP